MRAEPRDFPCATPAGFAEQTADQETGDDQSHFHVLAGDRIAVADSLSSGWDAPAPDASHLGELGIGATARLRDILSGLGTSVTFRSTLIGGALVAAFGLGFASASMLNSKPDASLASLDWKADVPRDGLDTERQAVRRHHRIAGTATTSALSESNKPKLSASTAGTHPSSQGAAQIRAEPQSLAPQRMQERTPAPKALVDSADSNPPPRLAPAPETRPTTIAGWSVRDVYGESAVLVGPDRVWTVRMGDSVPGVGRIDSIVRWGNRWIVATTAGLISTE